MHSNFIIPPDYVKSVLIINATEEQIQDVALAVQNSGVPYNIYLYDERMDDQGWMLRVYGKADVVLQHEDFLIARMPHTNMFGPTHEFKNPVDFFTK